MTRHPRLALPFTVLTEPGCVRLVAGEDLRYTLRAPDLDAWLPPLLRSLDGRRSLPDVLDDLPSEHRAPARALLDRLYGERVLLDAAAPNLHTPTPRSLHVLGRGPLLDLLPSDTTDAPPVRVLCQDRLDYAEAQRFNLDARAEGHPSLWVTTGPRARGFVGPLVLPKTGPCLACLLAQFRRLSPAPDVMDALTAATEIEPVDFPVPGLQVLAGLVRWKRDLAAESEPPSALYRLHVLDVGTLEVSSHRVLIDPECSVCRA